MSFLSILAVTASSFFAAWAATAAVIPLLKRCGAIDVPNHRSSHEVPTPRGGGIGILIGLAVGIIVAVLLGLPVPDISLLLAVTMVALVGFADDQMGGVPVTVRLLVQGLAAGIVVMSTGGLARLPIPAPLEFSLGILAIPVAIFWIVAVTNIFNFLDGVDGFAGLQSIIAGLGIGLWSGNEVVSVCGFAVAGASLAFLLFNWHPASVFMGDVGAPTLGFLFAALPMQLEPPLRPAAVFAVAVMLWFFLADATFTMLARLTRREPIWKPHRSHLYQRLVQSGLSHDSVVMRVMSAAAVLTALVVVAGKTPQPVWQWSILAAASVCFAVYLRWVQVRGKINLENSRRSDKGISVSQLENRSPDLQPNSD
jgi:UDP-N-acetylmuramyl pentapeptide phosphotransferase/UDP-N-acetylglucosamine-1-phosphate transferase